jgi:hypothetical protein
MSVLYRINSVQIPKFSELDCQSAAITFLVEFRFPISYWGVCFLGVECQPFHHPCKEFMVGSSLDLRLGR